MDFYIDEDVDLPAVRRTLLDLGHNAWHVSEAGRAGDSDASQLAYAISRGCVVITHDKAFVRSHRDMPVGRVITLFCRESDAAQALRVAIPEIVPMLERNSDVYVEVRRDSRGVIEIRRRWGTEPEG